ncbi:hypothetical protein F5B20DRAFT_592807 [Whalleya microplaca]|nr:hypothetical protein F5B20DRAFT_592807 [Whalleya microplaca]
MSQDTSAHPQGTPYDSYIELGEMVKRETAHASKIVNDIIAYAAVNDALTPPENHVPVAVPSGKVLHRIHYVDLCSMWRHVREDIRELLRQHDNLGRILFRDRYDAGAVIHRVALQEVLLKMEKLSLENQIDSICHADLVFMQFRNGLGDIACERTRAVFSNALDTVEVAVRNLHAQFIERGYTRLDTVYGELGLPVPNRGNRNSSSESSDSSES